MDPLAALALLPADVDHEHLVRLELEHGLRDADCARAAADDVLFGRGVAGLEEAVEVREEVDEAARAGADAL